MPYTVTGKSNLNDEAYVRTVIEELGGVRELAAGMREYREIVSRLRAERAALTERYPDKWIAMDRDGVIVVGDSMDEVLDEVESRGLCGGDVAVEFLDTTPPLLIL